MRLLLVAVSIICMPLAFLAGQASQESVLDIILTIVVPALVVILFFVLLLDALMNRVFMIEQPEDVQAVKRTRMRVNLLVVAGLVIFWFGYFKSIGEL